ncbi:MAG: YbhB/YbcL family Raf kinase inhibitor-like protein [Candidatus Cyclobacteriaceae bacterium M2_1C_046]
MESLLDVELALSSPKFENGGSIPKKYTCDGENVNPPIKVENLPEDTETLALIIEDPDAPNGTFDHWIVWNINPYLDQINEHVTPGVEGKNSFGKHHYKGPCPPDGEHRYFFRIYALNKSLKLQPDAGKIELLDAMEGNVLASGELMGRYKRSG